MSAFRALAVSGGAAVLVLAGAASALAQQPSPRGSQWTKCATEGQRCYIPYGTVVAYGANGVWARKTYRGAGNVDCSHRNFGDPLVGIHKSCFFRVKAAPPPSQPIQWSRCAMENEPCFIPYGTTVAYGANGVWTRKRFSRPGSVDCSNRMFGDPLPGVVKSCSFEVRR
ncbi:MAG: hypothetical protein MUF11_15675 [Beijerinckiaceae bacterium]|jgi:hypothetical protein|nr:hypothetical protein [Beijerinckiaceae bacterium]